MHNDYALLINLSVSLGMALVFGLITQRLHLSPIVGYLLAGIVVSGNTPGYVADADIAHQLAEIGEILLMFGVGLHFNLSDLLAVRKIALPGAVGQILVATTLGTLLALAAGFGLGAGLVLGIAVSVASTVVLVRVLMDNNVLDTAQGHIAVGWLVVEDIFTVLVLVALPALAGLFVTHGDSAHLAGAIGGGTSALTSDSGHPSGVGANLFVMLAWAAAKIAVLGIIVVAGGKKLIPRLLGLVARTRSRELFTLTVLVLALAIATGSAVFFEVSIALGAFLAGMVVGQTEVSHQAGADALPLRDAFAVLFFVSVGMRFDPHAVIEMPGLLAGLLAIVLIAKPLAAVFIVWTLRYSIRSALTVAVGLAQIGEFSFILADAALQQRLLSGEARSLLVACAIISITLNPLLFRTIDPWEKWLRRQKRLWLFLSKRSETGGAHLNVETQTRLREAQEANEQKITAVVVGYGPVGQTACRVLKEFAVQPLVIDLNLDTIRRLVEAGQPAMYGDATRREILEAAGIHQAKYLLVTIPEVLVRTVIILAARDLNDKLKVFVRARYLQERAWLEEVGATGICTEEGETAIGLAVLLLREVGADEERIRAEIRKIQRELNPPQAETDLQ